MTAECDGLAVRDDLFLACGFSVREEEIPLGDSLALFVLRSHEQISTCLLKLCPCQYSNIPKCLSRPTRMEGCVSYFSAASRMTSSVNDA